MTDKKVWFITGASRGMGVDFAKAALAAGNAVVATGRNTDAVARPSARQRTCWSSSWTSPARPMPRRRCRPPSTASAASTCWSTTPPTFMAGYFEELTPEQIEQQLATGLIGPMNVTRAVLPVMRKQRSGHIISISSGAGLIGL